MELCVQSILVAAERTSDSLQKCVTWIMWRGGQHSKKQHAGLQKCRLKLHLGGGTMLHESQLVRQVSMRQRHMLIRVTPCTPMIAQPVGACGGCLTTWAGPPCLSCKSKNEPKVHTDSSAAVTATSFPGHARRLQVQERSAGLSGVQYRTDV